MASSTDDRLGQPLAHRPAAPKWLMQKGEMGKAIADFPWEGTPFGRLETWPAHLRMAVNLMLGAGGPIALIWGPDFRLLYNDGYRDILQDKHPGALGTPGDEVFPELWTSILPLFQKALSGEAVVIEDYELNLTRNGLTRPGYFSFSYNPVRSEEGDVGGFLAVGVESTVRVVREQERARVFDTVLSAITDFAYTFGRDGRFLYVNRALLDLWGLKLEEAVGKNFFDLKYPEGLAADLQRQIQKVIDEKIRVRDETPYVSPTGKAGYYEYIFSPVFGPDGSVVVVAGSTREITDHKILELNLRQSQERALTGRRLVENQNDALQLINSGAPLSQIFARLIAVVEAEGGGDSVGCVSLVDAVTGKLRHGAAPSLPAEFNQIFDGVDIDENLGTCSAAVARKERVMTADIDAAPAWQAWKHLPLGLGLRAKWSMPIFSARGQVLGAFGTYFRTCRQPTAGEIEMVELLSKTAALAIERLQAEVQLRAATGETNRQQRLYETVLSNTPDLVYVFDLKHRFTFANSALLSMWGRTWDQAIGKNCLELGYEPWHAEMHDREIDQVIVTKRLVRGEVTFSGAHGPRWYEYIFAPVIGVSGDVEAIAGTTRDMTDARTAMASSRFLGDLAQSLGVIGDEREIIRHTVAAVGRHFKAHRCYFLECLESENLLNVSENWLRDGATSLAGSFNLYDFGGPDWWREYSKGNFAVNDTEANPLIGKREAANYRRADVRSYMVQPVKKAGKWTVVLSVTEDKPRTWTEDELQLLENVGARVWPLVERARSDASLRVARDEALAAAQAKDDFLAALSHELRTPLNPVLLLATNAAGNPDLPEEVRGDFKTIAYNVTLEARLIDDLLDLTRIAHNKLSLDPKPYDIHLLLQRVMETIGLELKEKNLDMSIRLEAPSAVVIGDEVRLHQIFWNLFRNAVKFTPPGGRISVATFSHPSKQGVLVIEVSDTGIGLTADERARVFTPFTQGEHTLNEGSQYGGLGLGLAISRKIAELHSGSISVRSSGRDQGATFAVELPLKPRALSLPAPEPPTAELATGAAPSRFRRVLLVEDHDPSRRALARLLGNRKIEVTQAASAAEALEKARTLSFDLVISDIGLPDINGYDLMKTLQIRYGCKGIALSGYGTDQDIARSKLAGFMTHLTKPIQIQALDAALRQFAGS